MIKTIKISNPLAFFRVSYYFKPVLVQVANALINLVMADITKKWTDTNWNWGQTLDQLTIYFGDRISPADLE